jgi:hypothetical protein
LDDEVFKLTFPFTDLLFSLAFLKSQFSDLLGILLQQFFSLQQSSLQFIFPLQQSSSNTFPSAIHFAFSNSFCLQQFFSLQQSISLQKAYLHPKNQKAKTKIQKAFLIKKLKAKSFMSSFSESFTPSGKQGGAAVLGQECDIVTGETCIPASLNINNLGKAAVLNFPVLWLGLCQSQPTDKNLRKSN